MKPLVIYHAHCTDGFGAAYAAWAKLGHVADYLPSITRPRKTNTMTNETLRLALEALQDFRKPLSMRTMQDEENADSAITALRSALEAEQAKGREAVVYPPDGTTSPFTVINLGQGAVQMGDAIHDDRLPALWFGKNGKGMGHIEDLNRRADEGETLAVVTFSNVDGLDVLLDVVHRIRAKAFPDAVPYTDTPAQPAHEGEVVVTWDENKTRIVAVTRQDEEGLILSVLAEAPIQPASEADMAVYRSIAANYHAAQPAREWVGLDWSEIDDIANKNPAVGGIGAVWPHAFAADLSAKLREKNAGQPVKTPKIVPMEHTHIIR